MGPMMTTLTSTAFLGSSTRPFYDTTLLDLCQKGGGRAGSLESFGWRRGYAAFHSLCMGISTVSDGLDGLDGRGVTVSARDD